MLVIYCVSLDR